MDVWFLYVPVCMPRLRLLILKATDNEKFVLLQLGSWVNIFRSRSSLFSHFPLSMTIAVGQL